MKTVLAANKTGNAHIEAIRRMALEFLADTPGHVYLFGSWAKGTQRRCSDVDIAVEGGNPGKIGALRELLEESTLPCRVDVVDMGFASESLREEIRKDGVAWK
ncbi:MAG: nucleotidyltransferase domain-containing protein [Schwartzia sp.]|nr:nucleotidyltransferase domain-containing protein [Schwartzia sp. (in: firmicutes)]